VRDPLELIAEHSVSSPKRTGGTVGQVTSMDDPLIDIASLAMDSSI